MPIEQQVVKETVTNVATEKINEVRHARLQRARERAAKIAEMQENPDSALRVLAYGEGEGLRTGKDWKAAVQRAEEWRKKAARKPPRFGYLRSYQEARAKNKSTSESLGAVLDHWKNQRQERTEINKARNYLESVKYQYANEVNQEQARLIAESVKKKGDALTSAEINELNELAVRNVAAALEFQNMQIEKIRQEIEKNPVARKLIVDKIAEVQSKLKRPLSDKEINKLKEETINDLSKRTLERIRNEELLSEISEQQILNHPEFAQKFLEALGKTNIVDATPEQISQARKKAVEEIKKTIQQENEAKKKQLEQETQILRQKPEWQRAYALLLNQEISKGVIITEQIKKDLMSLADKEVRAQEAEVNLTEMKSELAEKERVKEEAEQRVRIVELSLRVKEVYEELAKSAQPSQELQKRAADAEHELSKELEKHKSAAEKARRQAEANPKNNTLQEKARILEERAVQLQNLADSLKSQEIDDIRSTLTTEKNNLQLAKEELIEAKNAVKKAELQVYLLKNTNLLPDQIPQMLEQVPDSAIDQINKALNAETEEKRLESIKSLKEKAKQDKTGVAATILLALLVAIGLSLEKTAEQIIVSENEQVNL
ncbi:MAG: hypothetical protein KatS3mg089_0286 [Patescibacteria group bacterium]|nr:MAG: hypothetical protein KatS3mg089_0286 [Patescibacteria group bacterium]